MTKRKSSSSAYHDTLRGSVLGALLPFEILSGNGGTLSNGITYTTAITGENAGSTTQDGTNGDVRFNNNARLLFTFSAPVNIAVKPVTDTAAPIGTPLVWSDPPAAGQLSTRIAANSATPLIYNAGAIDVAPDAGTTGSGFPRLTGTLPNASAPPADQDWGEVLANNVTILEVYDRDNGAFNLTAQPI